jgi:hypothetical protein
MKTMVCCQAVNRLKSMVARPVTVAALTQRKRASMYDTWFLPLEAYRMAEKKRGTKVL